MLKTKRQRAVALALIAFFCVGATTYVAVDWKRFGGGFLAFLRGKGDAVASSGGGSSAGLRAGQGDAGETSHAHTGSLPAVATASARRHAARGAHDAGGKSDEDLFKYGDPAAGGIPAGSFIVAQNDTGGGRGDGPAPDAGPGTPDVDSPAPGPGGVGNGGGGGGGIGGGGGGSNGTPPSPPPPPAPNPPASPPIDGGGVPPVPPGGGGLPPIPSSPSAVPEASSLSMMALGALFLAVAATRRRNDA